jgi:Fic family protein
LLFPAIEKMVQDSKAGFALTADTLKELHRIVIQDIYTCAGNFREGDGKQVVIMRGGVIDSTQHQPPNWKEVPTLVEAMCKYINENFGRSSAVHLCAYLMWRLNWIHPFFGGNGRTSRGVSYLVLNVRLGFNLPGINTIPQQIENDRKPYFAALRAADEAWAKDSLDVSVMEELVKNTLAAQLLSVHEKAASETPTQL